MALANTILSVVALIQRLSPPIIREDAVLSSSSSSSSPSSSSSSPSSSAAKVDAHLQKLAASLSAVLPVLDGAEESEDEHVKLWLCDLKRVAYDAEDVLEELEFDMRRRCAAHKNKRPKRQASDPAAPSSSSSSSSSSSFAARLREIRQRLDVIQRERDAFNLGEGDGVRRADTRPLPRLPSAARVDESRVFGRDGDLKKLVEMLLLSGVQGGEKNFSVVSIVGMGGLGKTTLAQMVYRDARISEHFEVRSWVHVSENFDVARLARAILESMTRKRMKHVELSLLRELLKEELTGKRFLLVLDDVWCEDPSQWEAFQGPLTSGARGSRVLVTTRMENVADIVCSSMIYRLEFLSQGHCWSLFSHYAFGGQSPPDAHPSLIEIGKRIIDKCRGHPYAVKTLAGLLQHETDESRWEKVLGSEIWEVSEGNRCILPGLKLGYCLLSATLKQCFSYCAVIPKIRKFGRGQLLRMWIAQGFLRPQDEKQLEDVANDCFDNLIQRSFLLQSEKDRVDVVVEEDDDDEDEELFMMHDLTHDMLKTISMDECLVIEEGNMYSISPNVQHTSVICNSIQALLKFQLMCPQSLRTFLLMKLEDELNVQLLDELFQKLKCLRVLDLSFSNLNELPASVGNLKHLRYLGLNWTNVARLPESVGDLYNLQTLELKHCELVELPKGLRHLINLRHIVYQNHDYFTTSLLMMPRGIGKLTCLRTLPIFVVSKDPESASLGELKDLNYLQGDLFIIGLHNEANGIVRAKEANLKGKKHLEVLLLEWGKGAKTRSPSICNRDEEMLKNLEPHTNLKDFRLDYNYRGFRFPKWIGDPSFSNLETVVICGCINCRCLPPLGQLPSLKFLSIHDMKRVQHMGSEFLGEGTVRGFPSLLALHFRDMPEWKHCWTQTEEGDFPFLQHFSLENCPQLESISLHNFTALQELTIKKCAEFTSVDCLRNCRMAGGLQREHTLSSLKHLEFHRCPKLNFSLEEHLPPNLQGLQIHRCQLLKEWSQVHADKLVHIPDLCVTGEALSIHDVAITSRAIQEELQLEEDLKKLELVWRLGEDDYHDEPEDVLDGLQPHNNLTELVIDGYRGLNFAGWVGDPSFFNLMKMTITNCKKCTSLPALGKLPSLKELHISMLPEVQSIGHEFSNGGFPSLETLALQDMPQWREWKITREGALPCLRDLTINRCPELERLVTALTKVKSQFRLRLQQFDDVTIFKEMQYISTCSTLCISQFPNLRELPHQFLPHNLKELKIEDCNRLKTLSHLPPGIRGLVLKSCNEKILCSPHSFSAFISLSYLQICYFPSLKILPLSSLPALRELCILGCPELVSICCPRTSCSPGLSMLHSIRLLSIEDCPVLEFSLDEQLPSLLQYMNISGCQFLAEWCQNHSSKISHVSKLWINGILVSTCDSEHAAGGLITSIEEATSNIRDNIAV